MRGHRIATAFTGNLAPRVALALVASTWIRPAVAMAAIVGRLVRRSGGAAGARHAAGKFGHSPARASCDPSGGTAMRAERLLLGASPVFKPRRSWRVGSYHTLEKW